MAASKCLYLGKYMVQCLYAQRHWIGIIDDPGIRGILFDGFCKLYIYRYGTERSHHASRPGCITYGLVYAQPFRHVDIHSHLVKCSRKDRDNNKISSCKSFLHAHTGPV